MKKYSKMFDAPVLGKAAVSTAVAQEYDIVINGGRVMDPETMYDSVANVGIKEGRIAVITKNKIKGKDTIEAKGLVVAPGFIDGHQHCIEAYAYRLMLRDGRTTIMDLEFGAHGPRKWERLTLSLTYTDNEIEKHSMPNNGLNTDWQHSGWSPIDCEKRCPNSIANLDRVVR